MNNFYWIFKFLICGTLKTISKHIGDRLLVMIVTSKCLFAKWHLCGSLSSTEHFHLRYAFILHTFFVIQTRLFLFSSSWEAPSPWTWAPRGSLGSPAPYDGQQHCWACLLGDRSSWPHQTWSSRGLHPVPRMASSQLTAGSLGLWTGFVSSHLIRSWYTFFLIIKKIF